MPPQNDEERAELDRLITQMREGKRDFENEKNDEVVQAITLLRERGWFTDGAQYRAELRRAEKRWTDLIGADLRWTDLRGANLGNADLSGTNLSDAHLIRAHLSGAHLSSADLRWADLSEADLQEADLSEADLRMADLSGADLNGAHLSGAHLSGADLSGAHLNGAHLQGATIGGTILTDMDLSGCIGLEKMNHLRPSYIDYTTFYKSGPLSEAFLKGCGVPENLITFLPSLVSKGIELFSTFISYSYDSRNPNDPGNIFAQKVHDWLQKQGVRCWLDKHQVNAGDFVLESIDEGIKVWDKLVFCCNERAMNSEWVRKELRRAIEKENETEKKLGKRLPIIIPLNMDDYLFSEACKKHPYRLELVERNAVDFVDWEVDEDKFQHGMELVLRALRLDGGKPPAPEPKIFPLDDDN
ncbi:toll/interleukin-1 receptor domain-containing protein [Phototrophicus methaneseepsis]|uniref:Toll/interleukin-1 receptor domain-containing protein n=1 Tax=Phototrophicus methaneseepsis TaxID=2710758 RepID=A0A7S8E963_9CHLR|nr:toll/interleukin-1 receptor domain-containing protein [Phototrophicus methaneseepsis]QPC82690.1 toll/interleukin-1 receptor domain-containing protein [Phototrophicus methaneseepsis]